MLKNNDGIILYILFYLQKSNISTKKLYNSLLHYFL